MKLPKRGFACQADGTVYWVWDDNGKGQFSSLPPFFLDMTTGTAISKGTADDLVVDLDDMGVLSEDMGLLYQSLLNTVVVKLLDGSYTLGQVMDNKTVVDHPFLAVINFRRQQRGLPPLGHVG